SSDLPARPTEGHARVPRPSQHRRVAGFDGEIPALFGKQIVQWRSTQVVRFELYVHILPRQIAEAGGVHIDGPTCFTIANDGCVELCLRGKLPRGKGLLFRASLRECRGDGTLILVSQRQQERGAD